MYMSLSLDFITILQFNMPLISQNFQLSTQVEIVIDRSIFQNLMNQIFIPFFLSLDVFWVFSSVLNSWECICIMMNACNISLFYTMVYKFFQIILVKIVFRILGVVLLILCMRILTSLVTILIIFIRMSHSLFQFQMVLLKVNFMVNVRRYFVLLISSYFWSFKKRLYFLVGKWIIIVIF